MKKGLAVLGDYWHKGPVYRKFLEGVFPSAGIDPVFVIDPSGIPWERLDDFDIFILSKEARTEPLVSDNIWYNEENERQFESYVHNGGSLFVLHSGLASYPRKSLFGKVMRGGFLFHPEEHPLYEVLPAVGAPDDLNGIRLSVRDELYFVHVDSKRSDILLESTSPDYGTFPAAWRHGYGSGKVFCFTPGHNEETLADQEYKRVIISGLEWLS